MEANAHPHNKTSVIVLLTLLTVTNNRPRWGSRAGL